MPLLPAAIGIILNPEQTEVLLVKRADVPVWVLPGGGVEAQESPDAAVVRELKEETGFEVDIVRKCAEYSPVNALSAPTHVYICRIRSGKTCLSSETKAAAFHPLAKLPPAFFHPHAIWLKEALTLNDMIRRPLNEISYGALAKFFLTHPWLVIRFAWTRWTRPS